MRAPSLVPPSLHHALRPARARPRRTCTSFSRVSACSGVFVRDLADHVQRLAVGGVERRHASAAATVRFQNVYRLRRYRSSPRVLARSRRRRPAPPTAPRGWYGFTDGPPSFSTSRPLTPAPGRGSSRPAAGAAGRAPAAGSPGRVCSSAGGALRRLPIRRARHDQSSACAFTSQPDADELGRQPVEQLRMARPLALRAEVLDRLDQAGAEVHLPVAVHRHARRQRVASGSTSHCARPSRLLRTALAAAAASTAGTPGVTFVARLVVRAAHQHECARAASASPP